MNYQEEQYQEEQEKDYALYIEEGERHVEEQYQEEKYRQEQQNENPEIY